MGLGLLASVGLNPAVSHLFLGSVWDEMLVLCGAAVFFAAARPGPVTGRLGDILAVVGFMGWGRRCAAMAIGAATDLVTTNVWGHITGAIVDLGIAAPGWLASGELPVATGLWVPAAGRSVMAQVALGPTSAA